MDFSSRSDTSLLRRLQTGEDSAARELYSRYAKRIEKLADRRTSRELASRLDPEDVVQSVFRTFFRRASDGEYALPEGGELWRLLLVIALNKVRGQVEHHRAHKRDIRRTQVTENIERLGVHDPTESAWLTLKLVVEDLLGELSELNQRIIHLRIEGYEINDISARTQRSKRTVERVLQRFRTQLQQVIDEDNAH